MSILAVIVTGIIALEILLVVVLFIFLGITIVDWIMGE